LLPSGGSSALLFLRDNPGAGASRRDSSTPPTYFFRKPVLLLPPLLLLCKIRPLLSLNYQNLLMASRAVGLECPTNLIFSSLRFSSSSSDSSIFDTTTRACWAHTLVE
jgi:hypothetical protein